MPKSSLQKKWFVAVGMGALVTTQLLVGGFLSAGVSVLAFVGAVAIVQFIRARKPPER